MNELTLHYVNQADRERTIAEDLRNRQILATAGQDEAFAERPAATAPSTASTAPIITSPKRSHLAPTGVRAAGR